jgi:hypothetical protein
MKKIIKGKKYDTDTAKKLDSYTNGYNYGDLNMIQETLYIKKTGEYFLYGYGGANTDYAEPCGSGSRTSGEMIKPFTEREAKSWAEEHLSGEEYESIFGEVEE